MIHSDHPANYTSLTDATRDQATGQVNSQSLVRDKVIPPKVRGCIS
jgi:hypothetical protein